MEKVSAIILAAGKGKRFNSSLTNKVITTLNGKPMVAYTVERLKRAGIKDIVVVVGFAKDSVKQALGSSVRYIVQKELLGTGHAVQVALPHISIGVKHLLCMYGDHSAFYPPTFHQKLIQTHLDMSNAVTLVTVKKQNPSFWAWGRIIRDQNGRVVDIIEERDCTPEQKLITEMNAGYYAFEIKALQTALPLLTIHNTGEYYITDVPKICVSKGLQVGSVEASEDEVGIGVNTLEQKEQAQELFARLTSKFQS